MAVKSERKDDRGGSAIRLDRTYLHLEDGAGVTAVPVDGAFWATIDSRQDLQDGRLVTVNRMAETWPHWEMHPAGEEVVYLLSGAIDLVLDGADGERIVPLRDGEAYIVPRGTWHRAVVHAPGQVLFITRGAGTRHRPVS